ncbi:MAG: hypothetical protein WCT05_11140 [Lentisphaeria bacterium]
MTDPALIPETPPENTCASENASSCGLCLLLDKLKGKFACATFSRDAKKQTGDLPGWLLVLLSLTLLSMASQIKLPLAGGRLALADIPFALSFVGILWQSWKTKEPIYYPVLGLLLLIVAALANCFSTPGLAGAIETAQLIQQFFCGFLLFSYFLKHAPFAVCVVVSLGLFGNLLAAMVQTITYGFASIQAPADVKALPWGFGKALTGFFRSRMALSFYFAATLSWIQPQWLGRNPGFWRCTATAAASIFILCFIPHGMMLVLCLSVLLFCSLLFHKRAVFVNLVAAAVLLFSLVAGKQNVQRETILSTITPCKTGNYAGELKTCHLDFLAALRMAAQRPWYGVGSGRYQECIGRCYGDLPNPSYNDIDSDTQAGWGILAGTLGFPLVALLALTLLAALGISLKKHLQSKPTASCLSLSGFAALLVFGAGMFISDPLTRGLCWFLVLAMTSTTLPAALDSNSACSNFSCGKIFVVAIALGLLLFPIALRKAVSDPLRNPALSSHSVRVRPAQGSESATAFVSSGADVFLVLNTSQVKEFTPPFEKHQDSLASEKTALRIPDGKGVPPENEAPSMKYGGALFEFEVPQAAKCKIWVRTWWDGSCGNTLNLQIDEEPRSVTIGNDGTYHTWHWLETPKTYELSVGKHTLRLLNREDGIAFDQILITTDIQYYPQEIEEQL